MTPFPDGVQASEILRELRAPGPMELAAGRPRTGDTLARLRSLSGSELLGRKDLRDPDAAACVRAGLLLLANDLDGSHRVSQSIETTDGSYWHGIMHRREPDYSNSKYWFRRVGDHEIFDGIATAATSLPGLAAEFERGQHDPFHFIDLVETCARGARSDLHDELLELQDREFLLLLTHCYHRAIG